MVISGSVPVNWNRADYENLQYFKQPIKQEEINTWRDQGYYHQSFSGWMYDSRNPMPEFVNAVAEHIGLHNCGFVIYRMDTLDIMPTHVDHYETYERVFNVPRDRINRALVMLEDWQAGHYLEVDGVSYNNWRAGDYVVWSADVPHAAANIGRAPRYTLQITGDFT